MPLVAAFGLVLPGDTDTLPVLPVFTARPVLCFARVTDDDPRAGVLHEVRLDVLSRRPADALVEVAIGDGARPGSKSVVVIDVDVAAEEDELRERSAHLRVLDDLIKGHVVFADLGNVPVRVDVRVVDVLSATVPRCGAVVLVDVPDGMGAPEHERVYGVVWMVVDPDLERAVVGDAAGGDGDELADGENTEQRTILVTFALEAAQLFRARAGIVLDVVEGGHCGSIFLCVLVLLTVVIVSCVGVWRAKKPRTSCVAWSGVFLLVRVGT